MKALLISLALVSTPLWAKQIIKDAPAQAMYEEMARAQAEQPDAYVMYSNLFFGDDYHPERGKLRLTTIYAKSASANICYQSDYFEAKIIDYMCEMP